MRAIITPSSSSVRIYLIYFLLSITLIIISTTIATTDNNNNNNDDNTLQTNSESNNSKSSSSSSFTNNNKSPKLTSDSVVLITGAAGFIGSELAITLKRTYDIKKLLLVDNLGLDSENERSFVPPPKKGGDDERKKAMYETISEEELSLFEYKRQRAFRIFHELTSPEYDDDYYSIIEGGDEKEEEEMDGVSITKRTNNKSESIRFYRADMRPSIPEYFDFGEVPLLEGIFMSHPDITHVVHLAG